MTETPEVTRALVLAAGQGSRLGGGTPKPLFPLLGVPLLARTLFTLQEGGVTEACVVLGYQAERIRRALEQLDGLRLRVHWLCNEAWERPNGLSVLAAEGVLNEPFILTMSDHVFDPAVVTALRSKAQSLRGVILAIDRALDRVFNLEDATKVLETGGTIAQIGKSLAHFNAVDTGVFLASPRLFEALRQACAGGKETLSDGVQELADRGMAQTSDITGCMWQDVDTPADAREAERMLLASARKPSDGRVAALLNRPISLAISRRLAKAGVPPNHVTLANLGLGLMSAAVAALGGYLPFLASGILFQLTSILDGCDGEVAKLTFRSSRRGEWLDTIADNTTYVAWLAGLTVGVYRSGLSDFYVMAGVLGFVFGIAALASLYVNLVRHRESGSLLAVKYQFWDRTDLLSRFFKKGQHLMRRDAFAFLFMLLAIVGQLPLALPLFAAGTLFALVLSVDANLVPKRATGIRPGVPAAPAMSVPGLAWVTADVCEIVRSAQGVCAAGDGQPVPAGAPALPARPTSRAS